MYYVIKIMCLVILRANGKDFPKCGTVACAKGIIPYYKYSGLCVKT